MEEDPFVENYSESELKIVAEFLTNWTPFLTRDLCSTCSQALADRISSLDPETPAGDVEPAPGGSCVVQEPAAVAASPRGKISWADMVQEEDELELEEAVGESGGGGGGGGEDGGLRMEGGRGKGKKVQLSRDRRENIRFLGVVRKKDFICLERVKGRIQNVLDGLELHTGVFSSVEQNRIVGFIYGLQERGRKGEFGDQTYSEPTKWMRGKGRVTIQFGCCYNYAVDKERNPSGILRNTVADPLPPLLKVIIKRLVRWHVLPPSCVPDSCIINIYEPGDCIAPHIDSHDFVRPFSTVSFLSECNIVFGSNIQVTGAGEFASSAAIPLPVGSVLVLNGNGANLAKHAVPAVPTKRISITFRKMDESKRPFTFKQESDLQDIQPLPYGSDASLKSMPDADVTRRSVDTKVLGRVKEYVGRSPDSRSEHDSKGKLVVHVHEIGNPSNRSSRSVPRQFAKDSIDFGGADGSVGGLSGHKSLLNSRGISSPRDDGRPSLLGTPKTLVAPPMRIVCMDERRIVVRTDSGKDSLDNTPFELGDSETCADIHHRRRRNTGRSHRR